MGYFGFRAAPLGAVGADVIVKDFFSFAPRKVERAIPDAWSFATPESLGARPIYAPPCTRCARRARRSTRSRPRWWVPSVTR